MCIFHKHHILSKHTIMFTKWTQHHLSHFHFLAPSYPLPTFKFINHKGQGKIQSQFTSLSLLDTLPFSHFVTLLHQIYICLQVRGDPMHVYLIPRNYSNYIDTIEAWGNCDTNSQVYLFARPATFGPVHICSRYRYPVNLFSEQVLGTHAFRLRDQWIVLGTIAFRFVIGMIRGLRSLTSMHYTAQPETLVRIIDRLTLGYDARVLAAAVC